MSSASTTNNNGDNTPPPPPSGNKGKGRETSTDARAREEAERKEEKERQERIAEEERAAEPEEERNARLAREERDHQVALRLAAMDAETAAAVSRATQQRERALQLRARVNAGTATDAEIAEILRQVSEEKDAEPEASGSNRKCKRETEREGKARRTRRR